MNEDINRAHIGLEIASETIEMMNDVDGVAVGEDFPNLLDGSNLDADYYDKMSSAEYLFASVNSVNSLENSGEKLLRRIERNDAGFRRRRLFRIGMSVAASVCVISFMILFFGDKKNSSIEISCVYPDMEQPTLILSNGDKVALHEGHMDVIPAVKINEQTKSVTTRQEQVVVEDKVEWNSVIIPSKFTYNVTLHDGTEVYLNAESKLSYPTKFIGESREVILDGEAFFKVKKSNIPFIVRTNDIQIKVYGTEFNVNATSYGVTETLLLEGSVGVTTKKGAEVVLTPNDLHTLDVNSGSSRVDVVDSKSYISWMSNNFNYEKINLRVFLEKVSAWYGISFTCVNPAIESIYIDICADRTGSVDELIQTIEKITNFQFVRDSETKYSIK